MARGIMYEITSETELENEESLVYRKMIYLILSGMHLIIVQTKTGKKMSRKRWNICRNLGS